MQNIKQNFHVTPEHKYMYHEKSCQYVANSKHFQVWQNPAKYCQSGKINNFFYTWYTIRKRQEG